VARSQKEKTMLARRESWAARENRKKKKKKKKTNHLKKGGWETKTIGALMAALAVPDPEKACEVGGEG